MKTLVAIILLIITLGSTSGFAQQKSRKQLKEEKKLEKQEQVEQLVNARCFVFNAQNAIPMGFKSVNISTSSYTVKFFPELIDCYLPYFGQGYAGGGYGSGEGIKFSGKPDEFTFTKEKKNYMFNAVYKGDKDTYRLSLSVSFSGSATLTVTTNYRSSISFNGYITPPEAP